MSERGSGWGACIGPDCLLGLGGATCVGGRVTHPLGVREGAAAPVGVGNANRRGEGGRRDGCCPVFTVIFNPVFQTAGTRRDNL